MGVGGVGPRGPVGPEEFEPGTAEEATPVLPRSGMGASEAAAGIVWEARVRARDLLDAAERLFENPRLRADWGRAIRDRFREDIPRVIPMYGVGMPWPPGGGADRPTRPGDQRPIEPEPPRVVPMYGVPMPPEGGSAPEPPPERPVPIALYGVAVPPGGFDIG